MTQRHAMVTGGGQGIGRAISECLIRDGFTVMIAELDDEAGREMVEAHGDRVVFQPTDVSREADIEALAAAAAQRFGQVHALVNNVGIGRGKPVDELTRDEFLHVINTNLTSIFLATKHLRPHFAEAAAMVNIASTRALMSEPNTEAYAASKGGVVAITHALAASLGPQVRVNCISPGWIDSARLHKRSKRKQREWSDEDHAQHPAGRVGLPSDVGELAAFLLSDRAGFITGQNFVCDGGMTKKMIYV